MILWLLSCTALNEPNRSTDTRSSQFATDAEKIAFLQQYLTLPSPVEAAEYHIVYHDNSTGGVPGPSDWDMRVVLRVAPTQLEGWTVDMQPVAADAVDLAWGYELLPVDAQWKINSEPTIYTRNNVIVAVFAPEGILFKRVWTQ